VLEIQAGLTSVANEVVVLVMVGGVGSTAARGLKRPAGSSSWPGTTSTDLRQLSLGLIGYNPTLERGWSDLHGSRSMNKVI
jgi:hypothetical protein